MSLNIIRLTATYTGKRKKPEPGKGYIIYPHFNSCSEIVVPITRRNDFVYKSNNEFLEDWADLVPYQECEKAKEFIKSMKL